jgi:hypothetical protein
MEKRLHVGKKSNTRKCVKVMELGVCVCVCFFPFSVHFLFRMIVHLNFM